MPYLRSAFDEDDDRRGGATASTMQRTASAGGGLGGPVGYGTAPMGGPSGPTSGASPTGDYTNFDRYFAANKEAAGATANRLAGQVERSGRDAEKGLDTLQQQFNAQKMAGMGSAATQQAPTTPTFQRPVSQTVTTYSGGPQYEPPERNEDGSLTTMEEAGGKPGKPTRAPSEDGQRPTSRTQTSTTTTTQAPGTQWGTPEQEAAWRAGAEASYGGPSGLEALEGYGKAAADAREAERQARALGSEEGIQALLQESAGGPYSQAQSAFDAGLVGTAGRKRFQQARDRLGGVGKAFRDTAANLSRDASSAKQYVADQARSYQDVLDAWGQANAVQDGEPGDSGLNPLSSKPSYEDAFGHGLGDQAYGGVKQVAAFLDPMNLIGYDALGIQDPWSTADAIYRGVTGHEGNNNGAMSREVYDSMTEEEWQAYQQLDYRSQVAWAMKRQQELDAKQDDKD